ncbi:hypothetical protein [Candidatus Poriferisodalis sp.]|uniref:hypothetical protein n=1 Tax=Candidatus Poriferisodalis sp. TaxID=3101277 RepID=UPI003B01F178
MPPQSADRVPGTLHELEHGEFALETIGFVRTPSKKGENWLQRLFRHVCAAVGFIRKPRSPVKDLRPDEEPAAHIHIWGSGRDGKCVSLIDCIRTSETERMVGVAGGHEDWAVDWLADGDAWVTPEDQCTRSWLRTSDLRAWALHGQSDSVVSVDFGASATVDLREETLGTTGIGDISVSLVRRPSPSRHRTWDAQDPIFRVDEVVSWKLVGSLTLQAVAKDWANYIEGFVRFMTMTPSVITGVECRLPNSDETPLAVALTLRRLPRDAAPIVGASQAGTRPHEFLTTWGSLSRRSVDPMQVFARYVSEVGLGDAYVAMVSHLESQDRLLSRGADGALLNGVRSVEAQFVLENPGIDDRSKGVQAKINDAANQSGDVGKHIRGAWKAFDDINSLRIQVAHGKSRPGADFGLRCLGGAKSLQWIQRFHLLRVLGVNETTAETMICSNPRFQRDLGSLKMWSGQV